MSKTVHGTVYFDNAATTPVLPCAAERLHELTTNLFGNPSSSHKKGRQAQEVLDRSHESLGQIFQVPPTHVVFTSGGTESNNLAIWGALGGLSQAFNWLKSEGQGKLLTSTIEHPASGKVFEALECMGAEIGWMGVSTEGFLDLSQLEQELDHKRVRLLSIHHAHNEIGVVQDLKKITQIARARHPDILIHVDAVQSFLKVPLDLKDLGIDMVSISGHKIGGPKGIGALILGRRFENRTPKIGPLIHGSSQQFGIRPGTVPVPSIGAFLSAIEWGHRHFEESRAKLLKLRERLTSQLPSCAVLNGPTDVSPGTPHRSPQTVNFSIPSLSSAIAVEALSERGYCASSGAACHSTNPKPNEALMEMGVGRERALTAIRVSFSSENTIEQVDGFIQALDHTIKQYAS